MKKLLQLGFAFSLAACAHTSYVKDAQLLSEQRSPETDELLARNQALVARTAELPPEQVGVSDVSGRLAANKSELESIKTDLAGSPGKVLTAEKDGKAIDAKAIYESERASSTRLPAAKSELDAIESRLAELERQRLAATHRTQEPARYSRALSTGYQVAGNPNGVEAQLVAFIEDTEKPVDKTTWFNFDRLNFKTGSAELDVEQSKAQLMNVAEILKAFPAVKLKVGGYTDNVGRAASNLKLSAARAHSVVRNLVELGVPQSRLEPEGYGAEHPECPANDSEECRAKNRRIALRVTAK